MRRWGDGRFGDYQVKRLKEAGRKRIDGHRAAGMLMVMQSVGRNADEQEREEFSECWDFERGLGWLSDGLRDWHHRRGRWRLSALPYRWHSWFLGEMVNKYKNLLMLLPPGVHKSHVDLNEVFWGCCHYVAGQVVLAKEDLIYGVHTSTESSVSPPGSRYWEEQEPFMVFANGFIVVPKPDADRNSLIAFAKQIKASNRAEIYVREFDKIPSDLLRWS